MHAAAIDLRGGGVSPRGTLLRGQSIIEYVLIIAIIGLVIVFAGPGVAGAIRNQFNQVTNTVNTGTTGGVEGGAAGGGNTGTASTTVQAAVAKDAKDWTLGEQKAVAEDIAKNGTSSIAYAKAKAAMDAGTKFSVKLTNGKTLEYRIVGIDHDDLADGSGKAGLTFLATSTGIESFMIDAADNAGGWEKSELRAKMNSGEVWNLMSSDFQSKVKPVRKLTNNVDDSRNAAVTATTDKLFLLSRTELDPIPPSSSLGKDSPWLLSEGFQYEAFKDELTNTDLSGNPAIANGNAWWQRSIYASGTDDFYLVNYVGFVSSCSKPSEAQVVCPAFCF